MHHGHHPADEGAIYLEADGERIDLAGKKPEEIVNLGVALVPEGRRLFPRLTVEENLLLGAYREEARRGIDRNLAFSFEAFPVLAERKNQLAGSMSGGEQQMLAVARALMSAPKVLLVDEPSVGLAPILVSRVISKIRELKEEYQLTVLMAEQNFNQAVKIADMGLHHRPRGDRLRGREHRSPRRSRTREEILPRGVRRRAAIRCTDHQLLLHITTSHDKNCSQSSD